MTQSMGPISLRVEKCLRENSWFLQTQMDRGKMGAGVKDIGMRHSPPQSVCIFKLTGSLPLRALYTFAGYTRKEAEFFQRNGSAGQLVGEVNFPNNGLARRSQPHSKATTSYKAVYDPQAP